MFAAAVLLQPIAFQDLQNHGEPCPEESMRPVVLLVGVGVLLTAAVVCGQDHAKDKKTQEQSKKSRESTNPKESPPPRTKAAGDKPAAKKSGKPHWNRAKSLASRPTLRRARPLGPRRQVINRQPKNPGSRKRARVTTPVPMSKGSQERTAPNPARLTRIRQSESLISPARASTIVRRIQARCARILPPHRKTIMLQKLRKV